MLQGLTPGEERNIQTEMKVFELSNPDKQIHTGILDIGYRYVGAYKVTVPAGSFDAVLIKWTFNGKVGPASLNDTQYRFFAADVGMVAAIEKMKVSVCILRSSPGVSPCSIKGLLGEYCIKTPSSLSVTPVTT